MTLFRDALMLRPSPSGRFQFAKSVEFNDRVAYRDRLARSGLASVVLAGGERVWSWQDLA